MKIHLNLATTDLERSVAFYETLLDAKPAKQLADYALFITDEPGLELALDLRDSVLPTRDAHFGVYVESSEIVDKVISRFQAARLDIDVEREETCCYANQTKVWTTDPEGRRWEVYTVHEDTEERDEETTTCCASDATERTCCVA
ncbi:MAG: ArsI/CadI family heavy metal resistance metalloenzyme [Candidatus Baltobacteraceae bacterium]